MRGLKLTVLSWRSGWGLTKQEPKHLLCCSFSHPTVAQSATYSNSPEASATDRWPHRKSLCVCLSLVCLYAHSPTATYVQTKLRACVWLCLDLCVCLTSGPCVPEMCLFHCWILYFWCSHLLKASAELKLWSKHHWPVEEKAGVLFANCESF